MRRKSTHPQHPVIFLDIDGTLHPFCSPRTAYFSCWDRLSDAIGSRPLQVVITSDWRLSMGFEALLSALPESLAQMVVGATPHDTTGPPVFRRYREVQRWIQDSGFAGSWIAIEDGVGTYPSAPWPGCIWCDSAHGAGDDQAEELRRWLTNPTRPPLVQLATVSVPTNKPRVRIRPSG